MKLEQQVTSLEISKRLKELGVKQESLFYHINALGKYTEVWYYSPAYREHKDDDDCFSAFTVAELGEMLKNGAHWANNNFFTGFPEWNERLKKWEYELPKGAWISCHTEVDARGKMLIFLLENNLLKS